MAESDRDVDRLEGEELLTPFSDEVDLSLLDEMLRLDPFDRLRVLARYVNGLRRFRVV